MADYFDPIDYLAYLRRNAKFAVIAIATAVILTGAISFLPPQQSPPTATLVLQPPAGTHPRGPAAAAGRHCGLGGRGAGPEHAPRAARRDARRGLWRVG